MDWDGLGKILTGKEIPLETSSNRSKRLMMSICVHRLTLQWVRIWNEKICCCCCWCADTVCFSRKKSFLWSSKYNDQMMLLLLTTMIDIYIYKERERNSVLFNWFYICHGQWYSKWCLVFVPFGILWSTVIVHLLHMFEESMELRKYMVLIISFSLSFYTIAIHIL